MRWMAIGLAPSCQIAHVAGVSPLEPRGDTFKARRFNGPTHAAELKAERGGFGLQKLTRVGGGRHDQRARSRNGGFDFLDGRLQSLADHGEALFIEYFTAGALIG